MEIALCLGGFFEGIWDFLVFLFGKIGPDYGGIVIVVLIVAYGLLRLSISIAPKKKCSKCGATGSRPGILGGMRVCAHCSGSGLRDRIGS